MEYTVTIFDAKLNFRIVEDAKTNSTGMNAILTRFTDLNRNQKIKFMRALNAEGYSEHTSNEDDTQRYNISAKSRNDIQKPAPVEEDGTDLTISYFHMAVGNNIREVFIDEDGSVLSCLEDPNEDGTILVYVEDREGSKARKVAFRNLATNSVAPKDSAFVQTVQLRSGEVRHIYISIA